MCASGYTLSTFFYYFVFGPGGPSSFCLPLSPSAKFPPNKQTNKKANNAWSQVSFILTPVSSAVTTFNKVVNVLQAKARIIQYCHAFPSYFALQTVKRPFQSKGKLFTALSSSPRPVLTLKSLSEGVVGHFRVFFNFAPCNSLLYTEQSRPPPHPLFKVVALPQTILE